MTNSGRKFQLSNILWRHPGHLIWIVAAYLPFLGGMSVPLTGDQKVYLSTSLEMMQRGSWLRPLLFGEGSYYKPPLEYWATILGWKVFGFGMFGAMLPSVLAMLLTCWLLGEIADHLKEKRAFVSAGLWFAAALGTVTYGTTAQMEIYLCLFYAAAWWAGLQYLSAPLTSRSASWLYVAFAVAGLSALIKSPLYSVFWVVGYITYLLVSGEWEVFRSRHLYGAWALGIVAGSVWYLYILKVDGNRFWADYVMRETWDKGSGNSGSALSLWVALLYFCFPFTLLLIPTVGSLWRSRLRTPGTIVRFAICWSWAPAVFFTLYPYRIKPYLYLLVPALALIADFGYFRGGRTVWFQRWLKTTGVIMAVVFAGVAAVLLRAELTPSWVAAGFLVSAFCTVFFSFTDRIRALALCGLAGVFLFRVAAVQMGEADLRGLREAVVSEPSRGIGMWDENRNIWHEIGLMSVGIGHPMARLHTFDQVLAFLKSGGQVVLTDTQVRDRLEELRTRWRESGESVSNLGSRPWSRWAVRAKFPFQEVIFNGRRGVADFDQLTKRNFSVVGKVQR